MKRPISTRQLVSETQTEHVFDAAYLDKLAARYAARMGVSIEAARRLVAQVAVGPAERHDA